VADRRAAGSRCAFVEREPKHEHKAGTLHARSAYQRAACGTLTCLRLPPVGAFDSYIVVKALNACMDLDATFDLSPAERLFSSCHGVACDRSADREGCTHAFVVRLKSERRIGVRAVAKKLGRRLRFFPSIQYSQTEFNAYKLINAS
jgi:hypothetical protein